MIEIEAIRDGHGLFCPACGIMTFSIGEDWLIDPGAELVMNDCSHLQFLGTDDGKEIDKNYFSSSSLYLSMSLGYLLDTISIF